MKKKSKNKTKKPQLNISKKIKFLKPKKGLTNINFNALDFRSTKFILGNYAVQATRAGILTKNQIESVRIYFKKSIKHTNESKVFVLVKPNKIVTKRSQETRMGRGKGSPKAQVAMVTRGQILYEIRCLHYKPVLEAFDKVSTKLSVPIKLIALSSFFFK